MSTLPILLLLIGCKPPVEAPDDINELSRFLYRVWDDPDEQTRTAGFEALDVFLRGIDDGAGLTPETGTQQRSWQLALLTEEDVADIDRPDRSLDGMLGIGVAYDSQWSVDCHAAMQAQEDQLPVEPSATAYVRRFVGVDDPDCFPEGTCDVLVTENDVRRKNAAFAATFVLYKSFRRVDWTDADGVARTGFYSRSWLDRSWPGEDDKGMMWQSYSIDVWMERPDGRAWRWQTLWSETEIDSWLGDLASDDTERTLLRDGINNAMGKAEKAIPDLGLCQ